MKKVVVVGGGASGLMAAYAAGKGGNAVILVERNEKLGKKIYITGKGRCNLTNDCLPDEFLQSVVRGEKFLRGAIYAFPPQNMMALLEEYGLALKTERGNRVFPASDHASDVTKTLERACRAVGVEIRLNERVRAVLAKDGRVCAVKTEREEIPCDCTIVATGGLSYPSTGSTGDGYRFAKEAGHGIISCVPSLTGLNLSDNVSEAQGVTVKNVVLIAKRSEKVLSSRMGELLFTHYGISGPLVLSLSAEINRFPLHEISLFLDLKPALDRKKLDERILRDFTERRREQIKNVLRALLPAGLIPLVLRTAKIAPEKQPSEITREERAQLVEALKALPLTPASLRGFEEAVVTSGGVDLKDIHPKTMESRKLSGLYFCGEVLDIDAYTGGFNLQIAFATGFSAGKSTLA